MMRKERKKVRTGIIYASLILVVLLLLSSYGTLLTTFGKTTETRDSSAQVSLLSPVSNQLDATIGKGHKPPPLFTQYGPSNKNWVTTNGTLITNETSPEPLNSTVPRPFVPSLLPNSSDPQAPCTTQQTWGTDNCNSDGNYFQSATLLDYIGNHQYDSEPDMYAVTVSFGSTNPSSALDSNNWISGGLSVTSPTSDASIDIGMNFYAYVSNSPSPNVGVAWYIVAGCEWPPDCGNGNDYLDLGNGYYAISGAQPSDQITLLMYYCQRQDCLNNNNGHGYWIFDFEDQSCCGSSDWTVLDYYPPSYQHSTMYYGIQHLPSAGYNPPFDYSYGSQIGVASNQNPVSNDNWEVQFSLPEYQISGYSYTFGPAYALTAGAGSESSGGLGANMGDAWWHYNWAWGGLNSFEDDLTVLANTPIKDLSASQVNGQTLTATTTTKNTSPSSGECVDVTNFATLLSDSGSEDTWALGFWIAAHPWANGILWNVISNDECAGNPITWLYASGYSVTDNSTALLGDYLQTFAFNYG